MKGGKKVGLKHIDQYSDANTDDLANDSDLDTSTCKYLAKDSDLDTSTCKYLAKDSDLNTSTCKFHYGQVKAERRP